MAEHLDATPTPTPCRVTDIEDPLQDATFGSIGRYVEVARPDGPDEPFVPQRLVLGFDEKQAEHVDPWTLMLFEVELESRSFTPLEGSRVDVDKREVTAWVDHAGTYGLIGLPKHPALLETLRLLDRYAPQLLEERESGEQGLQDRICGLILCADPTKWGDGPTGPGDLCTKCLGLDVSYGRLPENLLLEREPPLRRFPPDLPEPPPPPAGTPTILAWGANGGALGDGSMIERRTPVWVPGLDAKKIVGGAGHTIALSPDGSVWAWGWNVSGQLGDGTFSSRSSPGRVAGLTNAVDIAAGTYHALAVRSDGSVWTWGYETASGLGPTPQPVKVSGLNDAVAVAAGYGFNLALTRYQRVWAWGSNGFGQLGDGSRSGRTTPALVPGLPGVQGIAAASDSSYAVKVGGDLVAWGSGGAGNLGDGGRTDRLTPVAVPGLTYVQQVSAGGSHTLARDLGNDVWVWGLGANGQSGDGTKTTHLTPARVPSLQPVNIMSIAAGGSHNLALQSNGTVWTWGWNGAGQVGDGGTTDRLTPFAVPLPGGRRASGVGAGPGSSFAI